MNEVLPINLTHALVYREPKRAITLRINEMDVAQTISDRMGTSYRVGKLTEGLRSQLAVAVETVIATVDSDANHAPVDPEAKANEFMIIRYNGRTIISSRPTRFPVSDADKNLLNILEFARAGTKQISFEPLNSLKP